jgi:hypothetical protein
LSAAHDVALAYLRDGDTLVISVRFMATVTFRCQAKDCKVVWTDVDGDTARALHDMEFNGWQRSGLGGFVHAMPRSHGPAALLPS